MVSLTSREGLIHTEPRWGENSCLLKGMVFVLNIDMCIVDKLSVLYSLVLFLPMTFADFLNCLCLYAIVTNHLNPDLTIENSCVECCFVMLLTKC